MSKTVLETPKEAEGNRSNLSNGHFSYVSPQARQKTINPILEQNPKSYFIQEIDGRTYHIIFAFENKAGEKLSAWKTPPVVKPENDIEIIKPISKEDRERIEPNLRNLSNIMTDAFEVALKFHRWDMQIMPKGFIVEGHKAKVYGMATNWGVLGTKVSIDEVKDLNTILSQSAKLPPEEAKRTIEDVKTFFAASFAHEFSHNQRPDISSQIKSEILGYMTEITTALVISEGTIPFRITFGIAASYDKVHNFLEKPSQIKIENPQNSDRAKYLATLVVASILSEKNKRIEKEILEDNTKFKLDALEKIYINASSFIGIEDIKYLDKKLKEIMDVGNIEEVITEKFGTAAKRFSVKSTDIAALMSTDESGFYGLRRRE